MENFFEIASNVSTPLGIAGIALAVFFLISREIIRKNIFPTLTKNLSSEIIKLIIHRLFILALIALILGFIGFALTLFSTRISEIPPQPDGAKEIEYFGQVVDNKGNPIFGAEIHIRDNKGNIQVKKTDSVGKFQYILPESIDSAYYKVIANSFEPYERDMSPRYTSREPLILKPQSTPTPTPTPTLTSTAPKKKVSKTPTRTTKKKSPPCDAENRLVGNC